MGDGRWRFLNTDVYGRKDRGEWQQRRIALGERYRDYDLSRTSCQHGYANTPPLPSPFNMGNDWYDEVAAIIKGDLHSERDRSTWLYRWCLYRVFRSDDGVKENFLKFSREFADDGLAEPLQRFSPTVEDE